MKMFKHKKLPLFVEIDKQTDGQTDGRSYFKRDLNAYYNRNQQILFHRTSLDPFPCVPNYFCVTKSSIFKTNLTLDERRTKKTNYYKSGRIRLLFENIPFL